MGIETSFLRPVILQTVLNVGPFCAARIITIKQHHRRKSVLYRMEWCVWMENYSFPYAGFSNDVCVYVCVLVLVVYPNDLRNNQTDNEQMDKFDANPLDGSGIAPDPCGTRSVGTMTPHCRNRFSSPANGCKAGSDGISFFFLKMKRTEREKRKKRDYSAAQLSRQRRKKRRDIKDGMNRNRKKGFTTRIKSIWIGKVRGSGVKGTKHNAAIVGPRTPFLTALNNKL